MTANEIREKYIQFFEERGHKRIPSASLVPENDPTTLFTGSGMQPMLPYLLGEKHPQGTRIADSQKSFRAEDIDEVGDSRHTTFFEMLGNWSFGDYWKEEQLNWIYEFLTKEVGLSPEKLYVTVFAGDENFNLPKDEETPEIWKKIGIPQDRIFEYRSERNWWSRAGIPENMPVGEPGGPDSEIFYEFTSVRHDPKFGAKCHPNCECGRFFEIGNSVFMEYRKTSDTSFEKLEQQNVDFGGGLERIAAASIDSPDVFKIDALYNVITLLEKEFGKKYEDNLEKFRIITDHFRGAVFMLADGVLPSNKERGYILRRLIRRAVFQAFHEASKADWINKVVEEVVDYYHEAFPALSKKRKTIVSEIENETGKFFSTLEKGFKIFDKRVEKQVSGRDLFDLFTTYGFPLELAVEYAKQEGLQTPESSFTEFEKLMEAHSALSRTESEGKFKGGLADHSEKVVRLHTATHLLQAALRKVLGGRVFQKGSNITHDRTRFDFTHPDKMTDEQKTEVEKLVNEWIKRDLPVKKEFMTPKEAKALGAIGLFDEKYGEEVSVYTVYEPKTDEVISREFCGGPHVGRTGEIAGRFKIAKEQSVSSGVRRIKGVLEGGG